MSESSQLPAVAFQYNGTDVHYNADRMVSLTEMWKSADSPPSQSPKHWRELPQAKGFIENVATSLNSGKSAVIKSARGKGVAGTWAHWQVAVAYAKYLSHDFHRFVNEAFREWSEEKADPGLKLDRSVKALEKLGHARTWIERRVKGIGTRNALTATMADHNCKVRGKHDNPYAEGTRSISLSVVGKTPKEIRADKGLPVKANTRNYLEEHELVGIEWAETMARVMIQKDGADGNEECVERCRRAGRAVKTAIQSLSLSQTA